MEYNLIRKIAWSFNHTTGIEYEELYSEACLAYLNAEKTFNPEKGKKNTYLYHCMKIHLITYTKKQKEQNSLYSNNNIDDSPAMSVSFQHEIQALTEEAQIVCGMIFSAPSEYLTFTSKSARGKIYKQLRKKGWSWGSIWGSFREIKLLLNEIR